MSKSHDQSELNSVHNCFWKHCCYTQLKLNLKNLHQPPTPSLNKPPPNPIQTGSLSYATIIGSLSSLLCSFQLTRERAMSKSIVGNYCTFNSRIKRGYKSIFWLSWKSLQSSTQQITCSQILYYKCT